MRIVWDEKARNWYCAASAYTGFHRELARLILPYLEPGGTLCDLGCGLGLIDLELAPYMKTITCVDQNPEAVRAVTREVRRRGITNIGAVRADAERLTGSWDNVLTVFYGKSPVLAGPTYRKLCRKAQIAVIHGTPAAGFGPRGSHPPKNTTAARMAAELEALGVSYRRVDAQLEYGQPLKSRAEAKDFVSAYATDIGVEVTADYLDGALRPTGEPEFPWYLPNRKQMGIFIIPQQENAPGAG